MKQIIIFLLALNITACTYTIAVTPSNLPATAFPPQEVHLQWVFAIANNVIADLPSERFRALLLTVPDKPHLVEQAITEVRAMGASTGVNSLYDLREPMVNGRYIGHTRWSFDKESKCSVVELAKINGSWKVVSWNLHECNAIQDTILMSNTLPIVNPTSTPRTK
jgi:hypothetical protein